MRFPAIIGMGFLAIAQGPDTETVRARLDAYLLGYERQLSELVADEQLSQRDIPSRSGRQNGLERLSQTLTSEVAFIGLPGGAGWLGFRRVVAKNGVRIEAAGPDLGALLATGPSTAYGQARQLLADSAAYNLGLPRTTNLPNLPLEFLHPRNRRRFLHRLAGDDVVRGTRVTRMIFVERVVPTLIQSPDGKAMDSVVTAWIEPSSGRLLRAEVKAHEEGAKPEVFANTILVEFGMDRALGLMVPTEMREVFPVKLGRGEGRATYRNFRRFQTSARIVPQ
jgi:hypothetical protein